MSGLRRGVLAEEHELLGASFRHSETAGVLGVHSYAHERDDLPGHGEALLADLTGSTYLLVGGPDAETFSGAAFAGSPLAVGCCAWSGALSGDGSLLASPLLARCGDCEYAVFDPSARGDALAGWLGLLSHAESGGRRAFSEVSVNDASEMLVPLALVGPAAIGVLSDYLHGAGLPAPGRLGQLRLDAIETIVIHLAGPLAQDAFIVLVPPARARVLWRSLLSFTEVAPVGLPAIGRALTDGLPWSALLDHAGPERLSRDTLARWGLVRDGRDFVGARSLA